MYFSPRLLESITSPLAYIPSMTTQSHPGKGLSLPQLVFALNQELNRIAYSPSCVKMVLWERYTYTCRSFALEEISRLDEGTTAALTTIREWRNSFAPINRVPSDVLSLIPIHLSQCDRFHASFVCRHWRRTFLQRAELWSELFTSRGEVYVKTLLERAKGTTLDVFVNGAVPINTMLLLATRTVQIRRLEFFDGEWRDVQEFSEVVSGPLPLLHTLAFDIPEELTSLDFLHSPPPSPPPFGNTVNLKVLRFHSLMRWLPPFTPFKFPNLVSIDFSVTTLGHFRVLDLFDCLEASPMLRTVHVEIISGISFEGVPQGNIVVLPYVESFKLRTSDGRFGYKIAVHISCPSATFTSLTLKQDSNSVIPEQLFPARALWDAIIRQYTRSPVEEVTVDTKPITSKLTFRSADATVIELSFEIAIVQVEAPNRIYYPSEEILVQATRAVQNHPELADVKRLHICYGLDALGAPGASEIADEVELLFKSVGPLDELTICCLDLRSYCHSFLTPDDEEPVVFPPTKKLTISHPPYVFNKECVAIVELAQSQHALGTPFEQVVFRRERISTEMEEELKQWVGTVEYYEKPHDNT